MRVSFVQHTIKQHAAPTAPQKASGVMDLDSNENMDVVLILEEQPSYSQVSESGADTTQKDYRKPNISKTSKIFINQPVPKSEKSLLSSEFKKAINIEVQQVLEPGSNPHTPTETQRVTEKEMLNVNTLHGDIREQLRKESAAYRDQKTKEYKESLRYRRVGFEYQQNLDFDRDDHEDKQQPPLDMMTCPIKTINDVISFNIPKCEVELEGTVFDFYLKNTVLQSLDGNEIPEECSSNSNTTMVKDIKNIHISSEHQRAYIWSLIYSPSTTDSFEAHQLWLQVYDLSDAWSSSSSHDRELKHKVTQLKKAQDDYEKVINFKKMLQTVVQPEDSAVSQVHKNHFIQKLIEKERHKAHERKQMEKEKRNEIKQLQQDIANMVNSLKYQQKLKESMSIQHLTKKESPPMKAILSIFIGEFLEQENEFMHNKIISFYKQFVQSRDAFYFFKFENADIDFENKIKQQFPTQKLNETMEVKDGGCMQPYLYELNANSTQATRAMIKGRPVKLPIDIHTNQFAFIRSLDARVSTQFSNLDQFLVAIMKETKVIKSNVQTLSNSKKSRSQFESIFVETSVEIFKIGEKNPLIGATVDNQKIDPQFCPKNISNFHKPEQNSINKKKPVNCDFNFCGWYFVDEPNHNINFALLIDKQLVNMRSPFNIDEKSGQVEEYQSHYNFTKNIIPESCSRQFFNDVEVSQGMPVYCVKLLSPLNFARSDAFKNGYDKIKQKWLTSLEQKEYQMNKECAENIWQNLDYETSKLYILVQHDEETAQFEMVHPIIPEFYWLTKEGKLLKQEIIQCLNMKFLCNLSDTIQKQVPEFKFIYKKLHQTIDYFQIYQEDEELDLQTLNHYDQSFNQKHIKLLNSLFLKKHQKVSKFQQSRLTSSNNDVLVDSHFQRQIGTQIMQVESEDSQYFLHVIKTVKQLKLKRQNATIYTKTDMFESEDIKVFDYDITIASLMQFTTLHQQTQNEERNPYRRCEQVLNQIFAEEMVLQNPFDFSTNLLVLDNQEDEFEAELNQLPIDYFVTSQNQNVITANAVMMVKPKTQLLNEEQLYETEYNAPETKHNQKNDNIKLIRQLFHCKSIAWSMADPVEYNLIDFINHQSKIKVWFDNIDRRFKVKTINLVQDLISKCPQFKPSSECWQNQRLEPEPLNWRVLKTLMFDKMSFVTLKQQKSNPRNVVLVLKPKVISEKTKDHVFKLHQSVYFLGILNTDFEAFDHLKAVCYRSDLPGLTTVKYEEFFMDFKAANRLLNPLDQKFCEVFPQQYQSANQIAFDTSFSDAFGHELELMVHLVQRPQNAIVFYVFDYYLNEVRHISSIPLDPNTVSKVYDLQLARVSSQDQSYAVLLEFGSHKEIYIVTFTNGKLNASIAPKYKFHTIHSSLEAKLLIDTPTFADSFKFVDSHLKLKIGHQTKMTSLYRFQNNQNRIDGLSLYIDQTRIDIGYKLETYSTKLDNYEKIIGCSSSIFEYSFHKCLKIKTQSSNSETSITIARVQFRKDFISAMTQSKKKSMRLTEQQKLKLLNYFLEVLCKQQRPSFRALQSFNQQELFQSRYDLYGACVYSFLLQESSMFDKFVFDNLKVFSNGQYEAIKMLESSDGESICQNSMPRRLFELDMNMMSPISWGLHLNYTNRVKFYVNLLKFVSAKCLSREQAASYRVIFSATVNQLVKLGVIDLEEFINPDGVGPDIGCEMFQQTLDHLYLPQFSQSSDLECFQFIADVNSLECHVSSLFGSAPSQEIDMINQIYTEVQYGYIDLEWPIILNCFNQKPLFFLTSMHKSTSTTETFIKSLDYCETQKQSLIKCLLDQSKPELYTYESMCAIIDFQYSKVSFYFNIKLIVYVLLFMIPFCVELYYLDEQFTTMKQPGSQIVSAHILCCVALFAFCIIALFEQNKTATILNTLTFVFQLAITICIYTSQTVQDQLAFRIRTLYLVLCSLIWFQFLTLLSVFSELFFMLTAFGNMILDIKLYFVMCIIFNVLFSVFYKVLRVEDVQDIDYIGLGPLKWLLYVGRNSVRDYQVSDSRGFVPSEAFDNNGHMLELNHSQVQIVFQRWLFWCLNIILFVVLLMHFVVPLMANSLEQSLQNKRSIIYKFKASMINSATNSLLKLDFIQTKFDLQTSLIVRKKKFSDDIGERLDKHKWQGMTKALKDYIQFNVISKVEVVQDQNESMKRSISQTIRDLQGKLSRIQVQISTVLANSSLKQKTNNKLNQTETSQIKSFGDNIKVSQNLTMMQMLLL